MRAGGTSGVEPGTYCNPAETTLPLSSIVPFCRSFPAVRHKMKRSDSTSGVPSPGWRAEWDSNPLPPGCAAGAHPHVLPARMNGGRTDRPLIQLSSAPLIEKAGRTIMGCRVLCHAAQRLHCSQGSFVQYSLANFLMSLVV